MDCRCALPEAIKDAYVGPQIFCDAKCIQWPEVGVLFFRTSQITVLSAICYDVKGNIRKLSKLLSKDYYKEFLAKNQEPLSFVSRKFCRDFYLGRSTLESRLLLQFTQLYMSVTIYVFAQLYS